MWDVNRALKVGANVYHVYIASMIARFRELGLLKFGVILRASEDTGRRVAQYFTALGVKLGSVEEALELLNLTLGFSDEVRARVVDGGTLEVAFSKDTCKICPRNIGGLELPGPACPNVGFVKGFLEELGLAKLKEKFNVANGELPVEQRDGYCVIRYQILERKAPEGAAQAPLATALVSVRST
jgi:hypothetical protein